MTIRYQDAKRIANRELERMMSRSVELGNEICRLKEEGRIGKRRIEAMHAAHDDLCLLIRLARAPQP